MQGQELEQESEPVEDADGEGDVAEDGPGVGAVVLDLGLLVVIALDQEGLHYVH